MVCISQFVQNFYQHCHIARNINPVFHDDVIKWTHFPRYWPFVWGIHRSPVNSPHKVQWRGALMFTLIGVWINGWVNNREAGDLRRYRAHYDATVMWLYRVEYVFCYIIHYQYGMATIWGISYGFTYRSISYLCGCCVLAIACVILCQGMYSVCDIIFKCVC